MSTGTSAAITAGTVEDRQPRTPAVRRRRSLPAPALLLPAYLLLAATVVLPALAVVVLALFSYEPLRGSSDFVGLENFGRILTNEEFRVAFLNTLAYLMLTAPITLIIALLVALGIHHLKWGGSIWRSVFFLPVATTLAAMSVVWRWLFYPDSGLIDRTIGELTGLRAWLQEPSLALSALAVVGIWEGLGFAVVMFLAGLASVPAQLHEAARLDGAGTWSRFWQVTWPALGPAVVFTLIITTRNALRVFDQVQVMTQGGPLNSTTTLSYLLWERGIRFLDIGGGSVITLVLLALILIVTAIQFATVGRRQGRR